MILPRDKMIVLKMHLRRLDAKLLIPHCTLNCGSSNFDIRFTDIQTKFPFPRQCVITFISCEIFAHIVEDLFQKIGVRLCSNIQQPLTSFFV